MAAMRSRSANRKNALKSTGPKTPEGKARSAMNALKHGILSRKLLLPDEDQAAFEEFRTSLMGRLDFEGEMEALLADRVVAAAWRLRRMQAAEVSILVQERVNWSGEDRGLGYAFMRGDAVNRLCRYESALERAFYRALNALERRRIARREGKGKREGCEIPKKQKITKQTQKHVVRKFSGDQTRH